MNQEPGSIHVLGVKVTAADSKSILKYIDSKLQKKDSRVFVATPNPEMLVYATKHSSFKEILNSADIALPDGVGVTLGAWLLGKGIVRRITGVDMLEKLALLASENAYSMGLFGGIEGVAERAADCLRKKYPGVNIVYASSELDVGKMRRRNIDILLVALGHPKQEVWIHENLGKLQVKVAIGVGGSFDYLAGQVNRAPQFLRSIGLEWLYRLISQPWRWRRQLALIEYIGLIIQEKIKKG